MKVILLESSVRALENHVILAAVANTRHEDPFSIWHEPILSPVSSSFSSALSLATPTLDNRLSTSSMFSERSLPRRHHTIGNIRYDSSAYKTVSFQDDEPKGDQRGGGAGFFRHIKQNDGGGGSDGGQDMKAEGKKEEPVPEPEVEVRSSKNEERGSDKDNLLLEQQRRLNEEESDKLSNLVPNLIQLFLFFFGEIS